MTSASTSPPAEQSDILALAQRCGVRAGTVMCVLDQPARVAASHICDRGEAVRHPLPELRCMTTATCSLERSLGSRRTSLRTGRMAARLRYVWYYYVEEVPS